MAIIAQTRQSDEPKTGVAELAWGTMPRVTGLTCKEGGWRSPKGQEARRTPKEV